MVWTWKDNDPPWRTSTYERPFTRGGNYLVKSVVYTEIFIQYQTSRHQPKKKKKSETKWEVLKAIFIPHQRELSTTFKTNHFKPLQIRISCFQFVITSSKELKIGADTPFPDTHSKPGWGLTQPSIPLWVGKMSTSKNIG